MAKNKRNSSTFTKTQASHDDKPTTLGDLLSPDVLSKLKAQADDMKADEVRRKEEARQQAEDARKKEQKRLDNNFEHLLENSSLDWRKYK